MSDRQTGLVKPKAKATVVKSVKVDPETLFEIENDPRYTDFSTFTRDALMAYIESRKNAQGVTQGLRLQGQPGKTVTQKETGFGQGREG